MMLPNMLVQIGMDGFSLNYGFDWTIVAAGTAFTLYAVTMLILKHLPEDKKESKIVSLFESDRLK